MSQDQRFEDLHFENNNELQAIVSSLPKAFYETLHRGVEVNKNQGETQVDPKKVESEPHQNPQPDQVNIVNRETDEVVTEVSHKYELIQHTEAFQPILEAMNDLGLDVEGRVRKVNGGSYVNIEARFKGEGFNVPEDSDYMQGFFFRNSFDKGSSVGVDAFYERKVCSNGMVFQDNVIEPMKRKHLGNAQLVELYKEWFEELLEKVEVLQERLMEAREERIQVRKALHNTRIPAGKHERIKEQIEIDSNGEANRKALYDATTRMITAEVEGNVMPKTYRQYQRKAEKLLFNDKNQLEQPLEVEQ